MKNNNNNSVEANSMLLPSWATSKTPWDEARKLKLLRPDYQGYLDIDPGVMFFVLTLKVIGAQPLQASDGHPNGFHIVFEAPYDLAMAIAQPGFFTVALATPPHGRNRWCMLMPHQFTNERDKRRVLRWAAKAWQGAFWAAPKSADMKK